MSINPIQELAKKLVHYSTEVQKGENVLIEAFDIDIELVNELVKEVHSVGANPFVNLRNQQVTRKMLLNATEEQIRTWTDYDKNQMQQMQAYIGIRGGDNIYELSDVPADKLKLYNTIYSKEVHLDIRVPETKWVILRYPSGSFAQLSGMSTEGFKEFFFNVCTMDYQNMDNAMTSLVDLLNKTDKVRIVGKDTDLSFSIKDIPAIKCSGLRNIPDGEVFTAPVRDSVNGVISYNVPTPYQGFVYENVKLTFKEGKIVEATANNTEKLNEILNTDEGARYIGEFAIGVNPYILEPMKDILFDEKIDGSFHFTPGQAYKEADNGNDSNVHWDMVMIQRPEYGGGEIYFDDVLIRKDGRFVLPELECLNPENLK